MLALWRKKGAAIHGKNRYLKCVRLDGVGCLPLSSRCECLQNQETEWLRDWQSVLHEIVQLAFVVIKHFRLNNVCRLGRVATCSLLSWSLSQRSVCEEKGKNIASSSTVCS
ncbi:hypothetical protein BaRGS_00037507 [Batillaria attramentaria]|uniref:Uncharacterized protein n=1 Tax=Batillaria attramentaria TaxID=370345 RepID=A0ABD0J9F3_9CAEN